MTTVIIIIIIIITIIIEHGFMDLNMIKFESALCRLPSPLFTSVID